jgi:SAM-dependent methyltransferase
MDMKTVEVYNQKSNDYVSLVKRPPSAALIDFTKAIKSNGLVLDLGCGPGMASAYMRERGLVISAVDASNVMIKLANERYALNAKEMNFSNVCGEDLFDGVWANMSLLHAKKRDFIDHIQAIHKVLKPDGLFSIGMKIGSGERRDKLGRFYAYYSRSELSGLLLDLGFILKMEYLGEELGLAGAVEPWIIMRLQKE